MADAGRNRVYKTWLCGICGKEVAWPQFKGHLKTHGDDAARVATEWMNFLVATNWPADSGRRNG